MKSKNTKALIVANLSAGGRSFSWNSSSLNLRMNRTSGVDPVLAKNPIRGFVPHTKKDFKNSIE